MSVFLSTHLEETAIDEANETHCFIDPNGYAHRSSLAPTETSGKPLCVVHKHAGHCILCFIAPVGSTDNFL